MDYQTFIQKIRELTAEALGSAYRVELSAVPKNNGVMMDAIMIFREEENIAPTIYLRPNGLRQATPVSGRSADHVWYIVSDPT